MKLVASLVVKNELSRYLETCVGSLLEFCDLICALDDHSDDGTYEFLDHHPKVQLMRATEPYFYVHEGRTRNILLDHTLSMDPTHILHIDADEFIADGRVLRNALKTQEPVAVWTVRMEEIWKADESHLYIRCDGGWRVNDAPILWRVPHRSAMTSPKWRIRDAKLACGREPEIIRENWRSAVATGTEILHFGWTNVSERQARYERYVQHDGGHYHASRHLRSIMYPDKRVKLRPRMWPTGLQAYKEGLLERVNA